MSTLNKRAVKKEKALKPGPEETRQHEVQVPEKSLGSVIQILFSSPWPLIFSLIFGGCCSNVFTLEALVSEQPDSGYLLTVTQFVFVAVEGYIQFFDASQPQNMFLKKREVPLLRWMGPVLLFFAVSTLNNYVWVYHISVPVHIIFRSGGTVTTMLAGMCVGKRYSLEQIVSVIILTIGVIIATLYSNPGKTNDSSDTQTLSLQFAIGVGILAVAAILSSVQGLLAERIYIQYGKHWRESLFYTHVLSLPFFALFSKDIVRQYKGLMSSPNIHFSLSEISSIPLFSGLADSIPDISFTGPPRRLVLLILNAGTQYVCVRGVNNLAGNSTALTVSIVLNIRKFISLLLSIYLFGNSLSFGTMVGTVFVFAGAGMYSYSSQKPKQKTS